MQQRTSTPSDVNNGQDPNVVASALALNAGYVDTLGFVALFGLFTSHVTGNFVLIGSELASPMHGVMIKLLAFPAFICGVVLARFLVLRSERLRLDAGKAVLTAQGLLLFAFMVTGWMALPIVDSQSWPALTAGIFGAAAMGVQNGASRLVWSALSPTTVMTGNVTQLVIDLVDVVRNGRSNELQKRIYKFLWPVLAFGVGAMLGAFAFRYFSFFGLALPIAVIGVLISISARTREAVSV